MTTFSTRFHAALAAALLAGTCHDASAASVFRSSSGNAVGRCQGALPSYEGALRKRPLALQNEGAGDAFVTCVFLSDTTNTSVQGFGVAARSLNGVASTLRCTAVLGTDGGPARYATRSVVLLATGEDASVLNWSGPEFPGGGAITPAESMSLSCLLPPGVALTETYLHTFQNIGN